MQIRDEENAPVVTDRRALRASTAPIALDRQTTPERIATSLREQIAQGRLKHGTRIIEADFTQAFGVSRHTLREAISVLVGERLLTRTSFKGVEVTRLDGAEVRDIYAARRGIELPAVDALATAAPEIRLALTRSIGRLVALPSDVDSETMDLADTAVHAALVAAHGSRRISGAHATLMAELHILLFKTYGPRDKAMAIERHGAFGSLVDAADFAGARAQLEARLRASEEQMVRTCDI